MTSTRWPAPLLTPSGQSAHYVSAKTRPAGQRSSCSSEAFQAVVYEKTSQKPPSQLLGLDASEHGREVHLSAVTSVSKASPVAQRVKNLLCSVGDPGLIPG